MRRLTACACLAIPLLLTACGSTVSQRTAVTGAQAGPGSGALAGDGLGEVGPGAAAPTGSPRTAGGPADVAGVTGPDAAGVAGPGSAGGPGTSAPRSGAAATARGITDRTVTIGAAIPTGTEAAGSAFGISGAGSVSEEDMWNAAIADVNRSGGVLGRKLVLYNHSVDVATFVANPAQTYAEVCADFRDDHKVFAAMIYVADPSLRACLAKMGSPLIVYGAFTVVPQASYSEYGGSYFYGPSSITQERLATLFVQSLMANSFTAKWDTANGGPGVAPVKLGLIHADTPDQNNLYAAYTRELAKYGLTFADKVTYTGDASTALAATQSAVLKFSGEGITHVFGASAFFLRYAESQHYRPRYAFLPGLGALGAANSPAAQMKGAQTVGWAPTQDVDDAQDPGPTAGAAHCRSVMKAAGLTKGNRQDLKLMYAVCDAVYSFRAALDAGRVPSVAGLRKGFEALGSGFGPALTFTTTLGPGRHYGVNSVRDMAFDSACSCLKYTSRTNRS